jgi:pyruvate formate lyase activating enzyme
LNGLLSIPANSRAHLISWFIVFYFDLICGQNDRYFMKTPLITEIQRFSLQDGPGIRSTIFFKGCPLHCPWCHNPETQDTKREYYYYPERCGHCGRCAAVCSIGASQLIKINGNKPELKLDRTKCLRCMKCVDTCLNGARSVIGQSLSIDQIIKEVASDNLFYINSGGGVTLSGGEPLYFPEFSLELLKRLKKESLRTAMETSCYQRWENIEPLIPFLDLFIVDIKSLDAAKHKEIIGVPLSPILFNIEMLFAAGANVRIHLPIIPGFNDNEIHFQRCIDLLGKYSNKLNGVDILPYHVYGEKKYDFLGRGDTYKYKNIPPCDTNSLVSFAKRLKQLSITSLSFDGLIGTKNN